MSTSNPAGDVSSSQPHEPLFRVMDDWYVVCEAERLRARPMAVTLLGTPLVIFRGRSGRPGALLDRCPHRNVPLSLGSVKGDYLECAYHGWQFDGRGLCRAIPGHVDGDRAQRRGRAYEVREQQGYVWVYAAADVEPEREPFHFPFMNEPGYTTVRARRHVAASIHAAAENALDVPHTAYLHGGLFRSSKKKRAEIEVVVRRWHDRVEAEYIGEERPPGLAGRFLAPQGGAVIHFDRFVLPSITQVEYRLGDKSHIVISTAMTPVSDLRTELYSVISFRFPLPGWLVAAILRPIGTRIFAQDARMLRSQTENVRRFGGEQFQSTEIDVLGPHIYRLLKHAERSERQPVEQPFQRTTRMLV